MRAAVSHAFSRRSPFGRVVTLGPTLNGSQPSFPASMSRRLSQNDKTGEMMNLSFPPIHPMREMKMTGRCFSTLASQDFAFRFVRTVSLHGEALCEIGLLAGWIRVISALRSVVVVVVVVVRASGCRSADSGGSGCNAGVPSAAAIVATSVGDSATMGAASISDSAATMAAPSASATAPKRQSVSGNRCHAQRDCGSNANDGSV